MARIILSYAYASDRDQGPQRSDHDEKSALSLLVTWGIHRCTPDNLTVWRIGRGGKAHRIDYDVWRPKT